MFYVNLTNYYKLKNVVEAGINMTDLLRSDESKSNESHNSVKDQNHNNRVFRANKKQ